MTSIAVLGAGNVGASIARKWAAAGHQVTIGTRDTSKPEHRALVDEIGASLTTYADAVAGADVIVFAIPGSAMAPTIEALHSALDGKIAIDTTNHMGGPQMSSVGVIAQHAPGAHVARAFNTLGWENFVDTDFDGVAADLLWCGPDGEAGDTIAALITDVGLNPVRVGDLDQLAIVDAVASLWFALALRQGLGRRLAFKVLLP